MSAGLAPELRELVVDLARRTAREEIASLAVTRDDFAEIKQALRELTAVQARTDQAVERLTAAQARTDQTLEKLTAAQARTDQTLEKLTAAQARTDQAVERLTAAQARTEDALQGLMAAQRDLARQVGGLSETVGGDIEDIAYIVLHDVLRRELGWEVGVLERTWQSWDGRSEEVDVCGPATDPKDPTRPIWIVGEAKHNLSLKEVERFAAQVARARRHLEGEIFPVCFCYRARPEVQQAVRDHGLRLVFSYGKLV
jgi:hypothetical protein